MYDIDCHINIKNNIYVFILVKNTFTYMIVGYFLNDTYRLYQTKPCWLDNPDILSKICTLTIALSSSQNFC